MFGLATSLFLAETALAEAVAPAAQSGPAKTIPEKESYAGSIIGADVGTLAIVGLAYLAETAEIGLVAIPTYLLVPPIIHGVEGNWGGAALSVVGRFGVPILFAEVAYELVKDSKCPLPYYDPEHSRCERETKYTVIGASLGVLTAMALDAALLARRPVPKKQEAFVIVPNASWSAERGWALGVQGQF